MILTRQKLKSLHKDGFIRTDSYSLDEQHKFGHYDIIDGMRADGWMNVATVVCKLSSNGLGMVPLHPAHDKLVFGYVDGCFHPMLLQDDFNVTKGPDGKLSGSVQYRHITLRNKVHPNYPFLPPTKRAKPGGYS